MIKKILYAKDKKQLQNATASSAFAQTRVTFLHFFCVREIKKVKIAGEREREREREYR